MRPRQPSYLRGARRVRDYLLTVVNFARLEETLPFGELGTARGGVQRIASVFYRKHLPVTNLLEIDFVPGVRMGIFALRYHHDEGSFDKFRVPAFIISANSPSHDVAL